MIKTYKEAEAEMQAFERYKKQKGDTMETQNNETQEQKELLVKRYQNRKLYDTEASKYITLVDLQKAVKNGRIVKVIDHKTKKDLTKKALLMSLIESEGDREDLSTEDVMRLVKNGLSSKE